MIRFVLVLSFLWAADAPPTTPAHFHHLHLNTTDPAKAIEFYTNTFDCEKAKFAGVMDAVWAQKSWVLFTRSATPPPADITSAIWHFGWGAENMPDAYQKQLAKGTPFGTPITEMYPKFFFAYVDGPDHAVIELNTAPHHNFGHLHLLSEDAVSAGECRVVDHVGFSVDNLADSLDKLRKEGVAVTDEIKSAAGGKVKYAFIEGPDKIRIELVEGQAHKE